MPENKTKPTKVSVAAFIKGLAEGNRRSDAKLLVKMMQDVTGEQPKMWGPSIIGFGSYHYRYESGREGDMPLVGFSPRKTATVLYSVIGNSDPKLLAKLGKHKTGGGCLYISKVEDVDRKVLEAMITKSVATLRSRHSKATS